MFSPRCISLLKIEKTPQRTQRKRREHREYKRIIYNIVFTDHTEDWYCFLPTIETTALIKLKAAVTKHTFVMPRRGIRYDVTASAPIAEPMRSTLYSVEAIVVAEPRGSRDATVNSAPMQRAKRNV
jgi:hypothetical protein